MSTQRIGSLFPSRRQMLRLGGLGAAGLILGAPGARALADSDDDHDNDHDDDNNDHSCGLRLNLPTYPFFANLQSVMTEDRALLDRLVAAYARDTIPARRDPIDFIARYVPSYVFEKALKATDFDVIEDTPTVALTNNCNRMMILQ